MDKSIKVGDGATYYIGSDRYPFTIIEIVSDKKVILQRDHYRRIDNNGLSENQTYEYFPNSYAERIVVTKRKNGRWYKQGESMGAGQYSLGVRRAYQNPSY